MGYQFYYIIGKNAQIYFRKIGLDFECTAIMCQVRIYDKVEFTNIVTISNKDKLAY